MSAYDVAICGLCHRRPATHNDDICDDCWRQLDEAADEAERENRAALNG